MARNRRSFAPVLPLKVLGPLQGRPTCLPDSLVPSLPGTDMHDDVLPVPPVAGDHSLGREENLKLHGLDCLQSEGPRHGAPLPTFPRAAPCVWIPSWRCGTRSARPAHFIPQGGKIRFSFLLLVEGETPSGGAPLIEMTRPGPQFQTVVIVLFPFFLIVALLLPGRCVLHPDSNSPIRIEKLQRINVIRCVDVLKSLPLIARS